MSKAESPAPFRGNLIADCQHMATSAMGIAADLARLAEQECAGIKSSKNARQYIRHRIDILAEQARAKF